MILRSSADRPVLDVVEVVLDALLERRVAAPAVDLRPAGDAGLHLVAQHVLRDPVLELLDEERPLGPRADDRHVAPQHVPELRQLVEVEPAQPAADRRAARVVVARPDRAGLVLGALVHRAELVDRGTPCRRGPCAPACRRPGPATCSRISERDDARTGCASTSSAAAESADVDRALEHAVEALQRHVVEVDDRDAVEVLEPGAQRDELQQVGHDLDVDALAARRLDQAEHLHVLVERQRHVEVIDRARARMISSASASVPSSGRPR